MAQKFGRVEAWRGRVRIYLGKRRYLYTDRGEPFENREHAEAILAGIRHALTKAAPEVVLARYLPVSSSSVSVERWLPRWIEHVEALVAAGQRSPGTLREYQRYARKGGAFDAMRQLSLYEITFEALDDWRAELLQRPHHRTGQPVKPKLVRNVLGAFRAFLRWCRRRVPFLTLPEFPEVAVPEHPYVKVSPAARRAIIGAIPEERRGAFLAAELGIRPGELRALDVRDFDPATRELEVSRALQTPRAVGRPGPTKGRRNRTLPVQDALAAWIVRWRAGQPADAPLFPNPTGRSRAQRWHQHSLRDEWLRACRRVGVRCQMYEGTKHSIATELVERGVDLGMVQRVLGHADRKSTDHYTHRATAAIVAVLRPESGASASCEVRALRVPAVQVVESAEGFGGNGRESNPLKKGSDS